MGYADKAARMDAEVDIHLGDSISYSIGGAPAVTILGFVIDAHPDSDMGLTAHDGFPLRKRVKVNRADVPSPTRADRIVADRLGDGVFRPRTPKPEVAGRYYIFEVERV